VRRAGAVLALAAAFACAEGFAPGARVSLAIVPVFAEAAPGVLSGDLDVVRVRVARLPSNAVVIDTSVAVDTAGNVDLPLTVPLLSDPEEFEILLQGIRSSDNAVLYEGLDTVPVVASATSPPPVQIVISYIGPCQVGSGCQVTVGPQLTSLVQGDSVRMTVTVDSLGVPVAGVPVSFANLDTALIRVRSSGYVVARSATPGGAARVVADIRADADTLFLASRHPVAGADVSHRGGARGFVHVTAPNRLVIPDYSGNMMFNTLGNVAADPRAGLLLVDFEHGGTLQLSGRARIEWDPAAREGLPGAERVVEFEIDQVRDRSGG